MLKASPVACESFYGGLRISKLQFLIHKIQKSFTAVKFFQFLVITTMDSELDPDPQLGKVLDPDPHLINADPQPSLKLPTSKSVRVFCAKPYPTLLFAFIFRKIYVANRSDGFTKISKCCYFVEI